MNIPGREWQGIELPNDWKWQLVDGGCRFQSSEFNTAVQYGTPDLPYTEIHAVLYHHIRSGNEWGKRMSTVHVCDRCGAIVSEKAAGTISLRLSPNEPLDPMSLCPDCVSTVYAVLTEAGVKPENPSYKVPFSAKEDAAELASSLGAAVAKAVMESLGLNRELGTGK